MKNTNLRSKVVDKESTSTLKHLLPFIYPKQKQFGVLFSLSCEGLHDAIHRRHCIEYHAAVMLLTVTRQQVNTSWPPSLPYLPTTDTLQGNKNLTKELVMLVFGQSSAVSCRSCVFVWLVSGWCCFTTAFGNDCKRNR